MKQVAKVAVTATQFVKPEADPESNQDVDLECAIVIYRKGGYRFPMYHAAAQGSRSKQLGHGRPITFTEASKLVEPPDSEADVSWIPANLIKRSSSQLVWTMPPATRMLWFKMQGQRVQSIRAPWPRLVLIADRDGELRVFAIKGAERPTPDTPLFHAPLMNINSQGLLCFGNVSKPEFSVSNLQEFEKAITHSHFTHTNNAHTFADKGSVTDDRHIENWREISRMKDFPEKKLRPAKITLRQATGR